MGNWNENEVRSGLISYERAVASMSDGITLQILGTGNSIFTDTNFFWDANGSQQLTEHV